MEGFSYVLLCQPFNDRKPSLHTAHSKQNQQHLFDDISRLALKNTAFKAVKGIKCSADCRHERPNTQAIWESLNHSKRRFSRQKWSEASKQWSSEHNAKGNEVTRNEKRQKCLLYFQGDHPFTRNQNVFVWCTLLFRNNTRCDKCFLWARSLLFWKQINLCLLLYCPMYANTSPDNRNRYTLRFVVRNIRYSSGIIPALCTLLSSPGGRFTSRRVFLHCKKV